MKEVCYVTPDSVLMSASFSPSIERGRNTLVRVTEGRAEESVWAFAREEEEGGK